MTKRLSIDTCLHTPEPRLGTDIDAACQLFSGMIAGLFVESLVTSQHYSRMSCRMNVVNVEAQFGEEGILGIYVNVTYTRNTEVSAIQAECTGGNSGHQIDCIFESRELSHPLGPEDPREMMQIWHLFFTRTLAVRGRHIDGTIEFGGCNVALEAAIPPTKVAPDDCFILGGWSEWASAVIDNHVCWNDADFCGRE